VLPACGGGGGESERGGGSTRPFFEASLITILRAKEFEILVAEELAFGSGVADIWLGVPFFSFGGIAVPGEILKLI
jgi:hypothetical protein